MPIYAVKGQKKDGKQKYRVVYCYTDNNGKYKNIERTVYGKDEARQMESELQYKYTLEQPEKSMTVNALYKEYIKVKKHEVRESSFEKSKSVLKSYVLDTLGDNKIDKLTPKVLTDWKNHINSLENIKTIRMKKNIYSEFRAMLNFAVKMDYLSKNPLLKVGNFKAPMELKKEMDFYTADEFKKFIAAAKEYCQKQEEAGNIFDWNYYVFFCIAFYTGMRKGEIYALRWCDIINNEIRITRSLNQQLKGEDRITPPKNKSSIRSIQIPRELKGVLDAHKSRCMDFDFFSDASFVCGGETAIRNSPVARMNELFAKTAGLKRIRIHDYRHSHASLLANEGISIHEIARRLGHSTITQTLETYSHLYPSEIDRALKILDNMDIKL